MNHRATDVLDYKKFEEFYLFYLGQHSQRGTRVLHFVGTLCFLIAWGLFLGTAHIYFLLAGPLLAYFFAWISHFFIEKNKPATFSYPWFSLRADFKMFYELLIGRLKF